MIAEYQTGCGERCATLTHVLIQYHLRLVVVVVVIGTSGRTHIPDMGIVGVLGLGNCSDGLDVELVGDLEVDTPFHTVVFLVDTCH